MLDGFPDTTLSFFITSVISLFVIIDPPGNIFPFLSEKTGLRNADFIRSLPHKSDIMVRFLLFYQE